MPTRNRQKLHSRVVRLATIILPVAALALLSTVFMLARTVDPSDAIPFAEVDVSVTRFAKRHRTLALVMARPVDRR